LSRAYEILSKEDTKENYDKHGWKGLKEVVGDNPLADLFGFGGKKGKGNDMKKVRPKEVT
jgi:DnaJ-class molecular chaperone